MQIAKTGFEAEVAHAQRIVTDPTDQKRWTGAILAQAISAQNPRCSGTGPFVDFCIRKKPNFHGSQGMAHCGSGKWVVSDHPRSEAAVSTVVSDEAFGQPLPCPRCVTRRRCVVHSSQDGHRSQIVLPQRPRLPTYRRLSQLWETRIRGGGVVEEGIDEGGVASKNSTSGDPDCSCRSVHREGQETSDRRTRRSARLPRRCDRPRRRRLQTSKELWRPRHKWSV